MVSYYLQSMFLWVNLLCGCFEQVMNRASLEFGGHCCRPPHSLVWQSLQQLYHAISWDGSSLASNLVKENLQLIGGELLTRPNVVQHFLHRFHNDLVVRSLGGSNDFALETIRGLLCVTKRGKNVS